MTYLDLKLVALFLTSALCLFIALMVIIYHVRFIKLVSKISSSERLLDHHEPIIAREFPEIGRDKLISEIDHVLNNKEDRVKKWLKPLYVFFLPSILIIQSGVMLLNIARFVMRTKYGKEILIEDVDTELLVTYTAVIATYGYLSCSLKIKRIRAIRAKLHQV